MILEFLEEKPKNAINNIPLLSGEGSEEHNNTAYLLLKEDNGSAQIFEIRFSYYCSPFKQAELYNGILLVGFEEYFYMYDLAGRKNILALKMGGYFGSFKVYNQFIYVADAYGIHCIYPDGNINWQNEDISVDGITFTEFTKEAICGSAELNPPGGWKDFIIDIKNGEIMYME